MSGARVPALEHRWRHSKLESATLLDGMLPGELTSQGQSRRVMLQRMAVAGGEALEVYGSGESGMTWDRAVELAQIATGAGAVAAALVAVWVAFYVSGREDRRQRASERRALQRHHVVALQDAWLTLDRMQGDAITSIQLHRTAHQNSRADIEAFRAERLPDDPEARATRWEVSEALSEEGNRTGAEMTGSILAMRDFARQVELLESRVISDAVLRASYDLRRAVERMIWNVANVGVQAHQSIRGGEYADAFQRFIDATTVVLADLQPYEHESEETRRLRRGGTRIASNRSWEEVPNTGDDQSP